MLSFIIFLQRSLSVLLLALAAYFDVKTKEIPNYITFPAMALGLIVCVMASICVSSFSVVLERLILFIGIFFFGMLGMLGIGDIKLLMALSLLNTPYTVLYTIILACISIVAIQCVRDWEGVKYRVYNGINMVMTKKVIRVKKDDKNAVPFAPYLFAGYVLNWVLGVIF